MLNFLWDERSAADDEGVHEGRYDSPLSGDTVIVDVKEDAIQFRKGGEPIPVQMRSA